MDDRRAWTGWETDVFGFEDLDTIDQSTDQYDQFVAAQTVDIGVGRRVVSHIEMSTRIALDVGKPISNRADRTISRHG